MDGALRCWTAAAEEYLALPGRAGDALRLLERTLDHERGGVEPAAHQLPEDLLEVFVRRHETASTLITTNRPTQDWGIFLGDVPAATAILDRFLAHASIVPLTGKSYRLRQRTSTTDD